jgi:hypothetical protein
LDLRDFWFGIISVALPRIPPTGGPAKQFALLILHLYFDFSLDLFQPERASNSRASADD